jgi:hypothetical protein
MVVSSVVRFLGNLLFAWHELGLISHVGPARFRAAWKWAKDHK